MTVPVGWLLQQWFPFAGLSGKQFWNTTEAPLTSRWASTEIFFVVVGRGWRGHLLTFWAFGLGAYSKVGS